MYLEDSKKEIYKVELVIAYEDINFELRKEDIDGMKFPGSQNLAKAINSIQKYKSFTREEMRKELLARNFIFLGSCDKSSAKPIESDIYFATPWPPDSINALIGAYFSPNPRPNVALYFVKDTHEFTIARPGQGPERGECSFVWENFRNQFGKWLKNQHPNSHYFSK